MSRKYTFHLVGLAHLPTARVYLSCAFTAKNIKLSKMLLSLGHEVYFYGCRGEGERLEDYYDSDKFHFIETHTLRDIRKDYGSGYNLPDGDGLGYPWREMDFRHDFNSPRKPSTLKFYQSCIDGINAVKQPDHFLLLTQGDYHRPVRDGVGLFLNCEPGIGYRGSLRGNFRAFESSYIQNFTAGSEYPYECINGSYYDRVIPNYFAPEDVEYSNEKDDYYLFIGRMIKRKGIITAALTCNAIGKKLIIVGQGARVDARGYLVPNDDPDFELAPGTWEYHGYADVAQRKKLMARAIATFTPTEYLECLMPDEIILGANKAIIDMRVGDEVLQFDGSRGKVEQFIENDFDGECLQIKSRYLKTLKITPEHPVLVWTPEGKVWKKSSEIQLNDYLVIPKYKTEERVDFINLTPFITARCSTRHRAKLEKVKVDADLMWLFGTYLAEGNINKSKNHGKLIERRGLTFTFHVKETQTLNRVSRVMAAKFGYGHNISIRNDNSVQITFSSYPLANYFAEMFGLGARNKSIPQWIMNAPKNKLIHFLKGYISGDGGYTKAKGHRVLSMRTSSKVLALQLQLIATKFDILLSFTHGKREGEGLGVFVNQKDIYDLRSRRKSVLNPGGITTQSSRTVYREDADFFYTPVCKISKFNYTGKVYNLHTTDNTYLASNFVVHNCFAGTHVESMLSGTPPITTNFGVYPGTIPDVVNGVVGMRCNTLQDFVDAAEAAALITDHSEIRDYAARFLMDTVRWDFQQWFDDLYNVYLSTDGVTPGWSRITKQ